MTAFADPALAWDLQALLGEGALWDWRDEALWFTDIKRRKIYRFDPAASDRREWDAPEQVGFVVPARDGGFVAGLQSGLHLFDPGTGDFRLLVEVEPETPGNRLNDAVVDPLGRLWFGTMDDGERNRTGAFYSYYRGTLRPAGIGEICITNGPAVSPDGRNLYWVDTLAGTISRCAVGEDSTLGDSEVLVRIDPADGHPDGPTVDCDGCIWIGLYGGWEARRYSPDGELLGHVRFPVANVTKVAFGGPGLRTCFSTTARQKLDRTALEEQPLAGALFSFQSSVGGLPCPLADY